MNITHDMPSFLLGLSIALGGALLLAGGSELQSRAVYAAGGTWSAFIKSPRWILGLLLLGTAVSTNFVALALAPIGAVQSMSIVALASSAGFNAFTGRIEVTDRIKISIAACLVGILGFISVIATHPSQVLDPDLDRQLLIVMAIQAAVAVAGLVVGYVNRGRTGHTAHMVGLIVAAMQFGAITAIFKVMVGLVLRDGLAETLTRPVVMIALVVVAAGGAIAGAQFQLAHTVLPTPTVVAGLTITDTIMAATIGTLVLKESALSPGADFFLLFFGAIAIGGVVGLRKLRRTSGSPDPPPAPPPSSHETQTGNNRSCTSHSSVTNIPQR